MSPTMAAIGLAVLCLLIAARWLRLARENARLERRIAKLNEWIEGAQRDINESQKESNFWRIKCGEARLQLDEQVDEADLEYVRRSLGLTEPKEGSS